jgi:hypothetical protein
MSYYDDRRLRFWRRENCGRPALSLFDAVLTMLCLRWNYT